jgi:hypothetical protein
MGWLERWRQRRQQQRERKEDIARDQREHGERRARLIALTPEELAEKVAGSDLAASVSTEDMTRLAGRVAQLTDWERYILGMSAEGFSRDDISLMEYQPLQRVNVRRILKLLRGEPVFDVPGRPSGREPLESRRTRHLGRRRS